MTCGGKHHTILDKSTFNTSISLSTTPTSTDSPSLTASVTCIQLNIPPSLLCTALVSEEHGNSRNTARALLDTGATVSLVTSSTWSYLRLLVIRRWKPYPGKNPAVPTSQPTSTIHSSGLRPRRIPQCAHRQASSTHICEKISTIKNLPILQGKSPLADPELRSRVRVDILLGTIDVARAFRDEIYLGHGASSSCTGCVMPAM